MRRIGKDKKDLGGLERASREVLARVFGESRRRLGRRREESVISALMPREGIQFPKWFMRAVMGTTEQDRQGVDVIVHTDIGKLYLQIKGNEKAVRNFMDRHPKGNIVPFIIRNPDEDVSSLRERLLEVLEKERERILRLRSP